MKRSLLLAAFANTPWAMEPTHLSTLASVLRRWSAGEHASPEAMVEVEAAKTERASRHRANVANDGSIAVLKLYGVMSQRASMADDISGAGGTSTQAFTQALRDALADSSVGGIIIDIDSPGGSVFGTAELAAEIYSARGIKPIYGFVNSLSASAAYWTGAQCEQLFITQGGQAGSIGVYMQHVDESAALANEGYSVKFISAGKYKVEGNSLGPLDEEAESFLQSQVNSYYQAFTSAVAKGRGVPVATVRDGMGQGRCLMASDALAANMVDGICTFDDVVAKMAKAIKAGKTGARADASMTDIVADAAEHEAQASESSQEPQAQTEPEDAAVREAIHQARAAARSRAVAIASI